MNMHVSRVCLNCMLRTTSSVLKQLKQQQFHDGLSVLRLLRGLGLRGVQILAACFFGEKGLLRYAPDQSYDASHGKRHRSVYLLSVQSYLLR